MWKPKTKFERNSVQKLVYFKYLKDFSSFNANLHDSLHYVCQLSRNKRGMKPENVILCKAHKANVSAMLFLLLRKSMGL